jgi:hypothetical protein
MIAIITEIISVSSCFLRLWLLQKGNMVTQDSYLQTKYYQSWIAGIA